jgi:hypothetical protein
MFMIRRVVLVLLGVALLGSISFAAATAKKVTLKRKDGGIQAILVLRSGTARFDIKHSPKGVGLGPQSTNWYGGDGFLELFVDQAVASKQTAKVELVKEGPESVVGQITWAFEQGPATARFELKDGDDKLFVTFTFPKATKQIVRLRCYPSDFAGGWKQGENIRRRRVMTSKSDEAIFDEDTKKQKMIRRALGPDEKWVLFMDDHFDVAKTEKKTNGSCAIFLDPTECKEAKIAVGHYSSEVHLSPKEGATTIKCVLWDFTGKANAEAIEYMKKLPADLLAASATPAPAAEKP